MLLLFTAFIGVLLLPFIWLFEPLVTAPGAAGVALIVVAGILYMGALLLYLLALQTEEASVVAPYFQAGPLFGYRAGLPRAWRDVVGRADGGRRHDSWLAP